MTQEAIDFALTANEEKTAPDPKRLRQQPGEDAQSKAKRRATINTKRRLDGSDRGAEKPEGHRPEKVISRPKKLEGTNQTQVAGPQEAGTIGSRGSRESSASRPAKKAKDKGEALLVKTKTDKNKYAEVPKSKRATEKRGMCEASDALNVRKMILVLRRGAHTSGTD